MDVTARFVVVRDDMAREAVVPEVLRFVVVRAIVARDWIRCVAAVVAFETTTEQATNNIATINFLRIVRF